MQFKVNWLQEGSQFEAINETGGTIKIDADSKDTGQSPMELLISAIGGCSAIDVISILEKQKQTLKSLEVVVDADRQSVGTYSEYKTIHMHYILSGDLDPNKVQKALDLSIQKYCSVSKVMEKSSEITYDFEIVD